MKESTGMKERVKAKVRSAAGVAELEARIAELEAEVREYQVVHIRFAELVDVVTELLLPVAEQDRAKVEEVIARYTDELR